MWQPSSSQHNPGGSNVPMSLLKNFDPYEILEPQKIFRIKQRLIDIETDEPENLITKTASDNVLLPKIKPDLIDLFENIYVTPQHIEKKKEMDMKLQEQMEQNIRQITEKSKNDRQSINDVDVCRNCLSNINNLEENDAPKVLVPPKLKFNSNSNKVNENLIVKTHGFDTPVLKIKENVNTFQNVKQTFDELDLDSSQSNTNDDLEDHEELLDEILQAKSYKIYLKEQYETHSAQNMSTSQIPKTNTKVLFKQSQTYHNIEPKTYSINNNNDKLPSKSVKLLDIVKKDDKLYLKRRIIKSDAMKSGYTKGPDLHEKSIVLPQLLERLKERDKVLEERKFVKRRLILDTGSSTNHLVLPETESYNTPSLLNPVVLMEDCNRERLIGFKTREKFENFVRTGHY